MHLCGAVVCVHAPVLENRRADSIIYTSLDPMIWLDRPGSTRAIMIIGSLLQCTSFHVNTFANFREWRKLPSDALELFLRLFGEIYHQFVSISSLEMASRSCVGLLLLFNTSYVSILSPIRPIHNFLLLLCLLFSFLSILGSVQGWSGYPRFVEFYYFLWFFPMECLKSSPCCLCICLWVCFGSCEGHELINLQIWGEHWMLIHLSVNQPSWIEWRKDSALGCTSKYSMHSSRVLQWWGFGEGGNMIKHTTFSFCVSKVHSIPLVWQLFSLVTDWRKDDFPQTETCWA